MAQRPARKVLLVEDQTPIRTLLAETLQRAGFDVTACPTSKAALTAFPKIDPDLLIADIDLGSPTGSGDGGASSAELVGEGGLAPPGASPTVAT